ncbi:hypothetical protein [Streptomyces sp. NRRL F-5630]|uniref:hypothetical protein n=1 Tax=Streptomyces sp. NRRL F-5630 TaxID=1463864 RepID=UPI003EC1273C
MPTTELPRWVWDLVIAVQRHEEEHAKDAACLKPVLAAVPADVRDKATAIAQYVQQGRREDAVAAHVERMRENLAYVIGRTR